MNIIHEFSNEWEQLTGEIFSNYQERDFACRNFIVELIYNKQLAGTTVQTLRKEFSGILTQDEAIKEFRKNMTKKTHRKLITTKKRALSGYMHQRNSELPPFGVLQSSAKRKQLAIQRENKYQELEERFPDEQLKAHLGDYFSDNYPLIWLYNFNKEWVSSVYKKTVHFDEFGDVDYQSFASSLQQSLRKKDLIFSDRLLGAVLVERIEKVRPTNESRNKSSYHKGFNFEKQCFQSLDEYGYKVEYTSTTGDKGVDLLAEKDGIKYAIQCKSSNANIGTKAIQEVSAGRRSYAADYGVVVANSDFTSAARELAATENIILVRHEKVQNISVIADTLNL